MPLPTNTLKTVGSRLAWARSVSGLSCAQAATQIGVTRDTIVYAEQDRITLGQSTLKQLADVYDVRLELVLLGLPLRRNGLFHHAVSHPSLLRLRCPSRSFQNLKRRMRP
jgi:DNA-binding XRE family transcriptional regulator